MTPEKINHDIEIIDTHFRTLYRNSSEYERLLSRAVKLNEEVGELCEAVLDVGGEQRVEKTDIDFGSEIADVLICTLMIAKAQNIPVWEELDKKLEKIKSKFNIQ